MSVGQSSSVSESTGRPVGERTGRPVESIGQEVNVANAQIRTLLDSQKERILDECQAGIKKHEFQADYDRRSVRKFGQMIESQQEELHCAQELIISLNEMEELKKFQSSTSDTIARRRLVEDNQDTILELTGKMQDLQNEINCMNDSKDFQDAESSRSGNSHVTSRPVSFPPHPIPAGMLSRSIGMPEPQRRAAKHLGHRWYIGKRFCKSACILISSLSSRVESMELVDRRAASFIHSGKE